MRVAKGSFTPRWRVSSRKNEPEVSRSFRPGRNEVLEPSGDIDLIDTCDAGSFLNTLNSLENTTAGRRNHHDAPRIRFPLQIGAFHAHGMPHQQLLQEHAIRPETQRARTEPADGAWGDFEHPGPGVIHAKFRVHRSFGKPQRPN